MIYNGIGLPETAPIDPDMKTETLALHVSNGSSRPSYITEP